MQKITLNAEVRDKLGKGAARKLRREGGVPAVIYRAGGSQPLTLKTKETVQFIRSTSGEQVLVNIKLGGDESRLALLKEYQVDPRVDELLHVDFLEVSLTEKVKVNVHVSTVGEPIGVKRDKGLLQILLREIEVECLPDDIPSHLEIDVTALNIGQSVHVSDISVSGKVKVLTSPSEVIASVTSPTVTAEAAPAEEEAAAAEAAPEVVKKGKKEAEEGEKEKEKS